MHGLLVHTIRTSAKHVGVACEEIFRQSLVLLLASTIGSSDGAQCGGIMSDYLCCVQNSMKLGGGLGC